jgi:hypothetical protein
MSDPAEQPDALEVAVAKLVLAASEFSDAVRENPIVDALKAAYAFVARIRAERDDDTEEAARSEHAIGYRVLFAATILNAVANELAPDVASQAEVIRRMIEAQGERN